MNDAKALAIIGGSVFFALLILVSLFYGWVAVVLAVLIAFSFLMLCVGVDAANRWTQEEAT